VPVAARDGVQQHRGPGQVAHAVDEPGFQDVHLRQVAERLGLAEGVAGRPVPVEQLLAERLGLVQAAHRQVGVHLALDEEVRGAFVAGQAGDDQEGVGGFDGLVGPPGGGQPVHPLGQQVQRTVCRDRHREALAGLDPVRHATSIGRLRFLPIPLTEMPHF
jgi:hypothetical protein